MGKGKPVLPNIKDLIAAGFDPKTGLPLKFLGKDKTGSENLLSEMLLIMQNIDRQDSINRYVWYNLPSGIDGELLERMLYYKGQLCFFYMKESGDFYILPYTLNGTINMYGRFNSISPVPFNGTNFDNEGEQKPWISGLVKKPVYEIQDILELEEEDLYNSCVLLHDYSKGISETILPRFLINQPLIKLEAECIPLMRTSMIVNTGVSGMKVNNQDEYQNVAYANDSFESAALNGERYVPIVGSVDFQNLDTRGQNTIQEYAQTMQTLDNLRLSTLGLTNGGIFQKQGTILQSESDNATVNTQLILQEGLKIRQNFCDIVNSIWGLRIWCEARQDESVFEPSSEQEDPNDKYENENNESDGGNNDNE